MVNYIKEYFNKYLANLGDLETFNDEPRVIEYLDDGNKIRFHIDWFPEENEKPALLEIHLQVKINKKIYKGWIYRKKESWDITSY